MLSFSTHRKIWFSPELAEWDLMTRGLRSPRPWRCCLCSLWLSRDHLRWLCLQLQPQPDLRWLHMRQTWSQKHPSCPPENEDKYTTCPNWAFFDSFSFSRTEHDCWTKFWRWKNEQMNDKRHWRSPKSFSWKQHYITLWGRAYQFRGLWLALRQSVRRPWVQGRPRGTDCPWWWAPCWWHPLCCRGVGPYWTARSAATTELWRCKILLQKNKWV